MASNGIFKSQGQANASWFTAFLSRYAPVSHKASTSMASAGKSGRNGVQWRKFTLGKRKRSKGKEPMRKEQALESKIVKAQRIRPAVAEMRTPDKNTTPSGSRTPALFLGRRRRGRSPPREVQPVPHEVQKEQRAHSSMDEVRNPDKEVTTRISWRRLSRFMRKDSHAPSEDVAMKQRTPPSSIERRTCNQDTIRTPEIGEPGPSTWYEGPKAQPSSGPMSVTSDGAVSNSDTRPSTSSSGAKSGKFETPSDGGSADEDESEDEAANTSVQLTASQLEQQRETVEEYKRRDSLPGLRRAREERAALRRRQTSFPYDEGRASYWLPPTSVVGTQV